MYTGKHVVEEMGERPMRQQGVCGSPLRQLQLTTGCSEDTSKAGLAQGVKYSMDAGFCLGVDWNGGA